MSSLAISVDTFLKHNKCSMLIYRLFKTSPKQYPRDFEVKYNDEFTRFDLINHLIEKNSYSSYLEIGVSIADKCFNKIDIETKVGVDPDPTAKATYVKTSDDFFSDNDEKFDLIFIDGLHHYEQVEKDIINSLDALNPKGYIICHDMNPAKDSHQVVPRLNGQSIWNGDCWKAWIALRRKRSDINMCVINADHGLGVITKGQQEKIKSPSKVPWPVFTKYRKYLLNLVSVDDFFRTLN